MINSIRLKPEVVLIVTKAPTKVFHLQYRGRILGRNWEKNLKTFPPCSLQSPLLADFTPHLWFSWFSWIWDLERRKTWKAYPPSTLWFQKSIRNNESMKKTQVCSWIAFCRKPKPMVETSSLRNIKIMSKKPQQNFTFMNSASLHRGDASLHSVYTQNKYFLKDYGISAKWRGFFSFPCLNIDEVSYIFKVRCQ